MNNSQTAIPDLLKGGVIILDVRTQAEFRRGHVAGSINIPLQELEGSIGELDREANLILCCATGVRSRMALQLLHKRGFTNVHDGGGWQTLKHCMHGNN
ncbi:MAG: rhodanese-like domain-containing protein [Saprospiraceae bacterium]|nr:rhodanese-like domain-containing protein [Saprospiraceae bacterium]